MWMGVPILTVPARSFASRVCASLLRAAGMSDLVCPTVDAYIARAIELARGAAIPVFVDPKSQDFAAYRGAACLTPNLRELAAASHLPVGTEEEIVAAARDFG